MIDYVTEMKFKNWIITALNEQTFITDIDLEIKCLYEICRDLEEEMMRQIKESK